MSDLSKPRLFNEGPLEVGDVLHGYCEGYFGRDSHFEKLVVAIGGDWVVAREHGEPVFASCSPWDLIKHRNERVTIQFQW